MGYCSPAAVTADLIDIACGNNGVGIIRTGVSAIHLPSSSGVEVHQETRVMEKVPVPISPNNPVGCKPVDVNILKGDVGVPGRC